MIKKSIMLMVVVLLFNLTGYTKKTIAQTDSKGSDITGAWTSTIEREGQIMSLGFDFKANGAELTGTHTTPRGREFPIIQGRINGNDISFLVHVTGRPKIEISFEGKIIGKEIKLTMKTDLAGMDKPSEIILERVKTAAQIYDGNSRAIADAAFDELINRDFYTLAKRFSPEMNAAMPSEKLPKVIGPVLNSLGKLHSGRPEPKVTNTYEVDVFVYPAEFEKAKMTLIVSITAKGLVGGLFMRPPQPEPVKPGEFSVITDDLKLPATLTIPEGKGPFPAIVLVHGSGPGDQDETVGANKPFRDLAEGLAKHGIATLRYVKRTRQYPQNGVTSVKDEVIDDALNAVALARSQPDIDPGRVFLLGHSLGAYLAPRIAAGDTRIDGLIMLAGSVRPILEVARDQLAYLDAPMETLETLKAAVPASYWEDLDSYNPIAAARQLRIPVLILQGERDYQVTMKEFDLWKSGLQGHSNVSFKSYPKLNHLFLEGEGKSVPAEYGKPGHIPDYVYTDIAEFVNRTSQSINSISYITSPLKPLIWD